MPKLTFPKVVHLRTKVAILASKNGGKLMVKVDDQNSFFFILGPAFGKMSAEVITTLMSTWVPIFGAILSTGLGLAPLGDVLRCRRNRSLGEVGPQP